MTFLRRLWCRMVGHTDPREYGDNSGTGERYMVCWGCNATWTVEEE